jgi:hypothetical protein
MSRLHGKKSPQRQRQGRATLLNLLLGSHVRAQDGVDARLVAVLLAKPTKQVGVETHGHDGFRSGHYDAGIFPERGISGTDVWV